MARRDREPGFSSRTREALTAYGLLAPAMAVFALFFFWPFYRLIHYALYQQNLAGTDPGLIEEHPDSRVEKPAAQQQRPDQVNLPRHPQQTREQACRNQRRCVNHHLARRGMSFRIDHRQHQNAGPSIVFAVHPGDRQKVRELPEKQNDE